MANFNRINDRIKNINKTKKILKAMYLTSSIQMRKEKENFEGTKVFFNKIEESLANILKSTDIKRPYLNSNDKKNIKKAYIILSSDNGLVGQYNHNLINLLNKSIIDKENSILLIAGYMGKKLLKNTDYKIDNNFNFFINKPTLIRAQDIVNYLFDLYNDSKIDEVYIIYNDLENSFKQKEKIVKFFPIDRESLEDKSSDISNKEMVYEPSIESVFDNIMLLYLSGIMNSLLVSAYMSEQSSRAIAMNRANRNAEDIIKDLQLQYNKERQEKITTEITEIINN